MRSIIQSPNKNKTQVLIVALSFAFIGLFLQWWRMQSLNASMDQGILYQILWNTINGHPFESTLSSQLSSSVQHSGDLPIIGYKRLGQHFTPILIFWLPLVKIFGKWALPFLQVILITLSGLILYELSLRKLDEKLSAMIVYSFYGANAVIGPCLGNFTDLCQLPSLVIALILGLEIRNKWVILLTALAIPLIREDTGIVLMGVGIWLAFKDKKRLKIASLLIIYGGLWFLIVTNILMPLFSDDSSKRFMVENFGQYLKGESQASTIQVIWLLIQQPFLMMKEIFTPFGKTLQYILGQFLPLAFIPFLSADIFLLIGLPLLGLLIAQGNPLSINWRYTYLIVPGIFSGVVYWWEKNKLLFNSKVFRRIWAGCISLSLIFTVTSNPNGTLSWIMPESVQPLFYRSPFEQWEHGKNARLVLRKIPKNDSIAATNTLIPHLADREVLIRFPSLYKYKNRLGETKFVDWIIIDFPYHRRSAHVFSKHKRDLDYLITDIENIDSIYGIQQVESGIIVFKRGSSFNKKAQEELLYILAEAKNI